MAIKVGDKLPEGTLTEFVETERPGCTVGPNAFQVSDLTKGKKIVIFGLPGGRWSRHVPRDGSGVTALAMTPRDSRRARPRGRTRAASADSPRR